MSEISTPCPACDKSVTTLVGTVGIFEKTARVFYRYPFRCDACNTRFTAFKFGMKYSVDAVNRRQFQRVDTRFPVGISMGDQFFHAESVDISLGGCSVLTRSSIHIGAVITISLQIYDTRAPIWVDAAVVRSREDGGYGIEFLKFEEADRHDLAAFIEAQFEAGKPGETALAG